MQRILIVEDEFLIRVTLAEMLGDEGFEAVEAEDGVQALALLQAGPIDLVLTDVNLPGGHSGWAVADAARTTRPDMPVIFTSGGAEPPAGRPPSPYDAFVHKPYMPSELIATLRGMLGQPPA